MDIARSKKKTPNIKRYVILVLLTLPIIFAVKYLWFLGQADFSIDKNTMVFGEVKRGNFTVSVRGTGLLVPDNVQWLSASVDGKVERLVVKAGNVVKQGDLIIELSNPQLVQQLSEARWELEAMEAETKAAKIAQESDLLAQETTVLNAKLDYESSALQFQAESTLLETGTVSKLTHEKTELETDQFQQRWIISQQQYRKMEQNLVAQNNARAARLSKTRKVLERIQQQVDDLQVKATINSVVLEVPLEPGQRTITGSNIAKLAQQDSLIAELQVPEIQIRDVAVGQKVIIDTRNNKMEGKVARVDPAVINGNVQVDVVFIGSLPDDARPDLSIDGEIIITEIADTLYVERPLFAQSRSRSVFYKLTEDGDFAEQVEVKVGYGSVNQIQVMEGLSVGDKVITSDPSRWESYQKIRLN